MPVTICDRHILVIFYQFTHFFFGFFNINNINLDVITFLDNLIDEASLSIEREILEKVKDRAEEWLECEEIEFVCSLFDNADYLPDDTELVDANREA